MNWSPPPTLKRTNRSSELAEILEKWESTSPVFTLPACTDAYTANSQLRPGCRSFEKVDAVKIKRLLECNQHLPESAKVRVFLGVFERRSVIPEAQAYIGERTIISNIALRWFAMDQGPCFDPHRLSVEVDNGPFSSQFKFSKGEEEKSDSGTLLTQRAAAIFVLRARSLLELVSSGKDPLSVLTRMTLELGPDDPKVRSKVSWFFDKRKRKFDIVFRLLQGSASAILFAWNSLSPEIGNPLAYYPVWLGHFGRDPLDQNEIDLREKWLQSAAIQKDWGKDKILELVRQFVRPNCPLSLRLRLSKIVRQQPDWHFDGFCTVLFQLLKDQPWSLLEEALEDIPIAQMEQTLNLLCGRTSEVYLNDSNPSLKSAHPTLKEEGAPRIMARWIGEIEKQNPNLNLTLGQIQLFIINCRDYQLYETLEDMANKHIPPLSEQDKHELLVFTRRLLPGDSAQSMIVKLAVKDRVEKLRYIVASEGGLFDGSYPFAVCEIPKVQEFLRGDEASMSLEIAEDDLHYSIQNRTYIWKVRCTCQFHLRNTENCQSDPAFSVTVSVEEANYIFTKTADYFLLQQRLMEQRKEELAALFLLTGPTKRVLPPSINPAKRQCMKAFQVYLSQCPN